MKKIITQNFEKGFYSSTLLGWTPKYDVQGRPLNCDPNFKDGTATVDGKQYWFTRRGWTVRIWDRKSRYTDFMANTPDFIEEVDLTPDYLKPDYVESTVSNMMRSLPLERILRLDQPYSLPEVLKGLIEAADILLHKKDYDGHGWETLEYCYRHAKEIVAEFEPIAEKK